VQRLSRCTCNSDAHLHPGPRHKDGSLVGRLVFLPSLRSSRVGS
jgi:hypothetical protein